MLNAFLFSALRMNEKKKKMWTDASKNGKCNNIHLKNYSITCVFYSFEVMSLVHIINIELRSNGFKTVFVLVFRLLLLCSISQEFPFVKHGTKIDRMRYGRIDIFVSIISISQCYCCCENADDIRQHIGQPYSLG